MDSINNLRGMRTYLVGAMDRVHDGGVTWRQEISDKLHKMNLIILDPCDKPIHSIKEDQETRWWIEYYKETEQYHKIRNIYGQIRNADLRCVDVSDFIIAYIDLNVHACGTYEEIVTANRQKKPILVWCEQGKKMAPNWLFFMLDHEHIFNSMDEIIEYLEYINNVKEKESLKRWFFFKDSKI
ncbi:MAG: hypothetical protein EBU90_03890 [Proteobacteria bacterium]|nr:hypothetical protein [Pseudomonadota bacterium]NBP14211.1 hypothetical protein [bacterium]